MASKFYQKYLSSVERAVTGRAKPSAETSQVDATSMANPNRKTSTLSRIGRSLTASKIVSDSAGSFRSTMVPNRRDEVFSNPDSFSPDSQQQLDFF